jgi:isopentenyl diphosphate isomerase/L-lactate dehydrogenase-like FMN-dependent dehydrogenase
LKQPNINNLQKLTRQKLDKTTFNYLETGVEDQYTLQRNSNAFRHIQIRPRRLVDVSRIDTKIKIWSQEYKSPLLLAPVGMQKIFHKKGEVASVLAAEKQGIPYIASTMSSLPFQEIVKSVSRPPWIQIYPFTNRETILSLLNQAKEAKCGAVVLTVDVPCLGNREQHQDFLMKTRKEGSYLGNFPMGAPDFDSSITWNFIDWVKSNAGEMKIVLKGIMTKEDAQLSKEYNVDAIIVSNHGGRQLESNLSTIEVLKEIVDAVDDSIPVLIDGGIRRGSDIFKALALGATAVCVGRPYIYGLTAMGQEGVEQAVSVLNSELVRNMRLAGTVNIASITSKFVQTAKRR